MTIVKQHEFREEGFSSMLFRVSTKDDAIEAIDKCVQFAKNLPQRWLILHFGFCKEAFGNDGAIGVVMDGQVGLQVADANKVFGIL